MNEKRQNKRLGCAVPVDAKDGSIFDQLTTVDISRGGVGFFSEHEIPLNQRIAVELDLSEHAEPVFAIGRVKWVTRSPESPGFRIGMSFDDVFKGSKTRLNQFFLEK